MVGKSSSSSSLGKNYAMEYCDRPACDDMVEMLQKAQQAAAAQKLPSAPVVPKTADNPDNTTTNGCPPNSSQLGKASWTLLHSMAAWYPDVPTEQDQQLMVGFFAALAQFYPCTWCAQDFAKNIQQYPVQATSRTELCQWLCQQHNFVNQKLGKPIFDCSMPSLDERWRKSHKPECQKNASSKH
jgi:FAD-linked sulfhydryl oxidase